MSADDFQTKYSSVMESMLKSAIAETTKLFETMVDELKAEINRMKKENEDLKTRCSQFENARNQPAVDVGGTEPLPGPSDGCEKRDRAVQCDLVPFRTVLVEQCQPSLQIQKQQCGYEQMEYSLQDHTYGERTTQMAFILVKQEDCYDDSSQSNLKQEEAEPTVVRGLVLSENAGSPQASVCGTENEGPLINQQYSTGEIPFPHKGEDTKVILELPYLGMDSCLQGVQNQSSELEVSQVFSLAAVKDNMEEESAVSQISEMQGEHIRSEKYSLMVAQHQSEVESLEKGQLSVMSQQCQREGEMSVNEQADVTQQQYADVQSAEQQLAQPTPLSKGEACENLKSSVADDGACPQPKVPVQCKRGRPPKKAKHLQRPMKYIGSPAVSVSSSSKRCSFEKQKPSESLRLSMEIEEEALQAPSSEGSSAIVTLNASTVQLRERRSSVTLQDAILLVEAMNQSTVEDTFSSPEKMCAPHVGTLETVEEVPPEPQMPPLSVETAGSLPITVLSTTTQSTIEKLSAAPVTADATSTNEAQAQVKVVIPKQQHAVTQSSTTTSSMSPSTAAVQTTVLSTRQPPPRPLITSLAPVKAISDHILPMTRSVSSLTHHKIAALLPTQLPAVVSTVVAAQKKSTPPGSTIAGLPFRTPSISSVPEKKIFVKPRKLPPVVSSQLTPPHPHITIIVPRKISAVASRKQKSQTIFRTTMQQSAESAAPVTVSSPQLISSSQESSISVDTQMVLNEVAAISSQKKDLATNNVESPKQIAAVLEPINAPPETCSSSNKLFELVPTSMSPAGAPVVDRKLSAVVRLTRLPFPVSVKEAVLISRLPTDGSSESQSIVIEGTTQEKPLSMVISTQSSKTLVLSSDSCPILKETSVFQEESPDRRPSTGEPTSNSDEEISSSAVQDCASPNDPPIEEKQSATVLHLTSITTKDISDPHVQMTKAQFLAQLEVTPVPQDPNEASSNDPVDASTSCAETSTSAKKRLQSKSLVARLRSHLKTHLARRKETNPEPCTETETIAVDPKKRKLDNDSPNNINSTTGPSPLSLKDPGVVEDVTSPKETTNDHAPISPRSSGLCEADATPKSTVTEPTSVRSVSFKATRKSTPVSPSLGADGVGSKTKKSTSVSPRRSTAVEESASPKKSESTLSPRSNSTKQSATPKKTKSTYVSPRRSNLSKQSASPKKTKSTSLSPRRSNSTKQSAGPKMTKSTSVSPRRSNSIKQSASPKKTKSTSVSPRRSNSTKQSAGPKKTKSTSESPRRSNSIKQSASPTKTKSTSVSPRRSNLSKQSASPKKTKSTSLSPRRSNSTKQSAGPKRTKSTSVSPRRSNSTKESAHPKKTKSTSVSPTRSHPTKESATPKKTKCSSESPSWSNSTKQCASSKKTKNISLCSKISSPIDGASPKNGARSKSIKNTPVNLKRTNSGRDGAIPKKIKSTVSPRMSILSKNSTSPKVSTNESTSFCRRKCTLKENGSSSKQTKRESNSFSPRSSITTDGASAENTEKATVSPNVSVSRRKTKESTPAKKPILIKDGISPEQNLIIVDAKMLAKVTKANTIAKMKNYSQTKLQNGAKTGQLAGNRVSCETVRKCTSKAVWTPPRMLTSKTPPAADKKEASSPSSQDHGFVYPPSVSLRPIPVRAPPVVSPLQPLSVIGRRLLKNQCGECGRVLSSVAALESHVSLHAGRRPFSCTLCGKRFPDSKGLKRHGRVHRNGRIHICQQCGKGFVYRFGLTKHLQMVHRKIKPFICQICDKGYFTKRDVEAHIRIHTGEKPFHCNLCEKKFARRVELNVHLRWHNGEKRHWCPYCGKGFLDFNNLKRHKYIHTGEKPHSCPHCPKNFSQSGHLKKHVRNVHKIL